MITSYELGDEPSGSVKGRALATSLVTVSFLREVVMHGIKLVIKLLAPRFLYIGQAFRYSPENAYYIFNQQIYFIF